MELFEPLRFRKPDIIQGARPAYGNAISACCVAWQDIMQPPTALLLQGPFNFTKAMDLEKPFLRDAEECLFPKCDVREVASIDNSI